MEVVLTVISVGMRFTVTFIVLFSAGAYVSSPAKLTVMMALPSDIALTTPFLSTVAIFLLLELKETFPAFEGDNLAPIVLLLPTVRFMEVVLTVISVGIRVTFTLMVNVSLSTFAVI